MQPTVQLSKPARKPAHKAKHRAAKPAYKAKHRAAAKTYRPKRAAPSKPAAPTPKATGGLSAVVNYAYAQIGKRYVWGATGPTSFDCSGLLVAAWARIGVKLPHQSGAIARMGVAVPRSQWVPGTALIYSGHVAIYVGGGKMIHAANPRKGVLLASVYGAPAGRRIGG